QVAGLQREMMTRETDHLGNVMNKLAGAFVLQDFAIESQLHTEIVVVQAGHDHRPNRAERVTALGAPPLDIVLLPVPGADVVAAGYAENVIQRLVFADVLSLATNDDDQFRLKVH